MHSTVKAVFIINVSIHAGDELIRKAHKHEGYQAPMSISKDGTWVYAYFFYTQTDAESFQADCRILNTINSGHRVHDDILDVTVGIEKWSDSFSPIIWQVHGQHV